MANQYVNKVEVNGITIIDLTNDTVSPASLAQGFTSHDRTGALITGTASIGIDGDELAYGGAYVGTAIVGSAVLAS